MKRTLRILLNLLILTVIIGFGLYVFSSLGTGESLFGSGTSNGRQTLISPYRKINTIKAKSEIIRFDLAGDKIYMAVKQDVLIYDMTGNLEKQIPVGKEIRDIKIADERIYLLYPAEIEVFTFDGEKIAGWQARRTGSDYCSMALSDEYVFVTDVANKHICKYTKEGEYLSIILSPNSFIIPSYAFDIIHINDTIYCSNSGRHLIERYTLEGKYTGSFGKSGSEAGRFAGCCNPVYLAATSQGDILTSEKGAPRISCFSREGEFRAVLFNSKILGGGTHAYRVKVQNDKVYVAGKNTVSVFVFDPELAAQSACEGCMVDCPFK